MRGKTEKNIKTLITQTPLRIIWIGLLFLFGLQGFAQTPEQYEEILLNNHSKLLYLKKFHLVIKNSVSRFFAQIDSKYWEIWREQKGMILG